MAIRRVCARVYSIGGLHSGCAISGTMWLVAFTVQATRELVKGGPVSRRAGSHLPILLTNDCLSDLNPYRRYNLFYSPPASPHHIFCIPSFAYVETRQFRAHASFLRVVVYGIGMGPGASTCLIDYSLADFIVGCPSDQRLQRTRDYPWVGSRRIGTILVGSYHDVLYHSSMASLAEGPRACGGSLHSRHTTLLRLW